MFRFVCLLAAVAVCNAGVATYNGQAIIAPTITSEQQNVLRSYGNLQQVSYNSKTIDTPYSSVSKSDVRVSNPGIQVAQYATAPAYQQPAAYATKVAVAQPLAYAAPAAYHQTYSAPAAYQQTYAAPAQYQQAYAAPAAYHQTYAAPAAYHAQPLAYSAPAKVVASAPAHQLLGVAYSPATAVSHMSYSAPLISYAW